MKKPFFSIAIPTYEMHGKGVEFLEFNFRSFYLQSFKDFEVVISDHSANEDIEKLCLNWGNKLKIKYVREKNHIGSSSANINNAIINCSGEWIKILFQDDFFYNSKSLEDLYNFISEHPNSKWVASACEHSNDGNTFYRQMFPKWNNSIHYGNNTISSPSVITIKNTENKVFFDNDMIWLMDVYFYKKMYDKYGEPDYFNDINVVNRTWEKRLTNIINQETKQKEFLLVQRRIECEDFFNKLRLLQFDQNTLIARGIVDINEHLETLRHYSSLSKTVTEFGTRAGISTYALLIGRPQKVISYDINHSFFKKYEDHVNDFAVKCGTSFFFHEKDVLETEIEETDLLFIDTLHTYDQLTKELNRHSNKVKKWIILHDTKTFGYVEEGYYSNGVVSNLVTKTDKKGLLPAIEDFLLKNIDWGLEKIYENNNGLTILKKLK